MAEQFLRFHPKLKEAGQRKFSTNYLSNFGDGDKPVALLIFDSSGNLYGTTSRVGAGGVKEPGGRHCIRTIAVDGRNVDTDAIV